MNYWVFMAGRYRATSILGRVHAAFFNSHQAKAMIYMPNEIVLARMMITLDLEFEKKKTYALPVQGIWEWQQLWTPTSGYEACLHLFSFYHWGLLCPSWIHGDTMHYLPLHPKTTQKLAILWRDLLTPIIWWDALPKPEVDSDDGEYLQLWA